MVEILPAVSDCLHVGWALWRDHWEWYCANCGVTVCEYGLINDVQGHKPGDIWRGNE